MTKAADHRHLKSANAAISIFDKVISACFLSALLLHINKLHTTSTPSHSDSYHPIFLLTFIYTSAIAF